MGGDTLFEYAITPAEVPAGQTASFTVRVKNGTGQAVECSGITIEFPHDANAGYLTDSTAGIGLSVLAPASWQLTQQDDWTFLAQPVGVATGLGDGEVLGLVFDKVVVDATAATVDLVVTESTDQSRTAQIPVKKTQEQFGITELTASNLFIAPREPVTISWTTCEATGCTLSWNGIDYEGKPDDSHGVELAETTTFTLRADGKGGPVSEQITVTVANPEITYYAYAPLSGVVAGGEVQLMWSTINSQNVQLQAGDTPMVTVPVDTTANPYLVYPTEPTTYTLFANGVGSSDDPKPISPVVNPVVISSFGASPQAILAGIPVTLSWATQWSTGCSIDQGVGAAEPTAGGSVVVNPTQDTVYTLSADGYRPQTAAATVLFVPEITLFVLTGSGTSVSFQWDSTAAWWLLTGEGGGVGTVNLRGPGGSGSASFDTYFQGSLALTAAPSGATANIDIAMNGQYGNAQGTLSSSGGLNGAGVVTLEWSTDLDSNNGCMMISGDNQQDISASGGQVDLQLSPSEYPPFEAYWHRLNSDNGYPGQDASISLDSSTVPQDGAGA